MRVALCLSGMVRTLEQTLPTLRQHLIEPYSPDIFIHTYDKIGIRNDRTVSEEWLSELLNPTSLTIRSFDEWTLVHRRERDRLYCYPGPIWCCGIPGEMRWKLANVLAQVWHVRECDLLRREYERRNNMSYDLVIRARMDNLFLQTPNPFSSGEGIPDAVLFVPDHSCYGGTCDQLAMGNAASMAVYSDYALHFEEVYRSRVLLPNFWGPPENLLRRYLDKFTNLRTVPFRTVFELQREGEIEYQSHRSESFFFSHTLKGLAG